MRSECEARRTELTPSRVHEQRCRWDGDWEISSLELAGGDGRVHHRPRAERRNVEDKDESRVPQVQPTRKTPRRGSRSTVHPVASRQTQPTTPPFSTFLARRRAALLRGRRHTLLRVCLARMTRLIGGPE